MSFLPIFALIATLPPVTVTPEPAELLGMDEGQSLSQGWILREVYTAPDEFTYEFTNPWDGEVRVSVGPAVEGRKAYGTTPSFNIWYNPPNPAPVGKEAELEAFMTTVVERVRERDTGMSPFPDAPRPRTISGTGGPYADGPFTRGPSPPLTLIYLLYALAALALIPLARALTDSLRQRPTRELVILVALLVGGYLLRVFGIPHHLVKVGMVYPMMDAAAGLEVFPRYGGAAPVLYNLLFQVLPLHTDSILAFHSVLSIFEVLTAVALARSLLKLDRFDLLLAAVLVFTPVFLRDAASESILVPGRFLLYAGLLLLRRAQVKGSGPDALAALPFLALTTHLRPEFLVITPVFALVILAWDRDRNPAWPWLSTVAALWLVAAAFAALNQIDVLGMEMNKGDVVWSRLYPWVVLHGLIRMDLLARFDLFPAAIPFLAFVGLGLGLARREWRMRIALLFAAAFAWLAIYYIDINEESILRLHVGPAQVFAMIGVFGLATGSRLAARQWPALSGSKAGMIAMVSGLALCAGTAVPSARTVFFTTNSMLLDDLFNRCAEALPDEPIYLVHLTPNDPPHSALSQASFKKNLDDHLAVARVHRDIPTYLLRPPLRDDRPISVTDLRRRNPDDRPVYFFLGPQCYAFLDAGGWEAWDLEPDPYTHLHPACRWVLTQRELEPVHLEWMPNHGEFARPFFWYPKDLDGMTVGLFKVNFSLDRDAPKDSFEGVANQIFSRTEEPINRDDLEGAMDLMDRAAESIRTSPTLWEHQASILFLISAQRDSRQHLERSLDLWLRIGRTDIHYPRVLSRLGAVFERYRKYLDEEEDLAWIQDHLREEPDQVMYIYLLAMHVFYFQHDFPRAIELLEQVLKTVPDDPRVFLYLALSHYYMDHQEEAERIIEQGIAYSDESDPDLNYGRSIIVRHKDVEQAAKDIETYIEMSRGKDRVKLPAKQKWLRKELKNLREGKESPWWRAKRPDEPWKTHPGSQ